MAKNTSWCVNQTYTDSLVLLPFASCRQRLSSPESCFCFRRSSTAALRLTESTCRPSTGWPGAVSTASRRPQGGGEYSSPGFLWCMSTCPGFVSLLQLFLELFSVLPWLVCSGSAERDVPSRPLLSPRHHVKWLQTPSHG